MGDFEKDLSSILSNGLFYSKASTGMAVNYASMFLSPLKHSWDVKKIIYNDPATIVFWEDGTKTVVKRGKNEPFSKYHAFCAALAKKLYSTNSAVNRIVNSGVVQEASKKEAK